MAFELDDKGAYIVLSLREYDCGVILGTRPILRMQLEMVPRMSPPDQVRCNAQFQLSTDQAISLIRDLTAALAEIHETPPPGTAH